MADIYQALMADKPFLLVDQKLGSATDSG